jgi:hypothetical protein
MMSILLLSMFVGYPDGYLGNWFHARRAQLAEVPVPFSLADKTAKNKPNKQTPLVKIKGIT